jgi:hypothetical protein
LRNNRSVVGDSELLGAEITPTSVPKLLGMIVTRMSVTV